jgi:hypothetical protein
MIDEPKTDSDNWLTRQNTLIIIDEAQRSYTYYDFWNIFIKRLASDIGGPLVILFSSFGFAAGRSVELPEEKGTAPISLGPVSIRPLSYTNPNVSLYLNREEFNDAVARVCEGCNGNRFIPSDDLMQYIWDVANGHPGATRAVMEILIHSKVSINKLDNCAN